MTGDDPKGVVPVSTRVMNLANFLTQAARRNPDEVAFVHGARQWRWAELEERVNAMAYALVHDFGVRKGDRILVQSANCNQMFESDVRGLQSRRGLGADEFPTNAGRGRLFGAIERCDLADLPGRLSGACRSVPQCEQRDPILYLHRRLHRSATTMMGSSCAALDDAVPPRARRSR